MKPAIKFFSFLCFFLCVAFSETVGAGSNLETLHIIDWHVHVAGLGHGGSGAFVNKAMRENYRFRFFMRWMNVTEAELAEKGDQIIVKKLSQNIANSKYVDQAVVLAIDGIIDETGELDRKNTQFYVPNEFVAEETAKYPNLLFGASINPNRKDAVSMLEKVVAQGAVLVKLIPSTMHIDPSDERFIPFYKKMAELHIPLLTHTGKEKSFPNTRDELADPLRLVLPLELGVTVIAAHIATTGKSEGQANFERILPMFKDYPNLYADISSLTQINKLGFLARALKVPGLTERMLYGTDWPLQYFPMVSSWYHVNHIGLRNAWRTGKIDNPWDRDIELKQAFGVPDAVFTRVIGTIANQSLKN